MYLFIVETTSGQFILSFFFFNDTATTEIYTLSLHDALPISGIEVGVHVGDLDGLVPLRIHVADGSLVDGLPEVPAHQDRKSTRLNSSHSQISYAVFCLKKKTRHLEQPEPRPCFTHTTLSALT